MTTAVEVQANHGWPVRVTFVTKALEGTADPEPASMIVPPGERRTLYIHSHVDLIVHEIQPDEKDFNSFGDTAKVADTCEAEVVKQVTISAVGMAAGTAGTATLDAPVVQRTVTGYIEPITADKLNI